MVHILDRTEGIWERLRGKAVFLTGATGFFGRCLLEAFAAANRRYHLQAQAVVLSRQPEIVQEQAPRLFRDPAVRLVRGDVRTLKATDVNAQLNQTAPSEYGFVIHAASETTESANHERPLLLLETAFSGTQRALDFAVEMHAQSFLLTSSGAVYGEQSGHVTHLSETHLGGPDVSAPCSAYGEGKRLAEMLCHIYKREYGLACKIARCFAFVGPHLKLDAHYAIGNFLRDALSGGPIRVNGDGTPLRSYLYTADLAVWLWTILLHQDATGTYNVGSDTAYSIREIADCVARNSPHRPQVEVAQIPDPTRHARRYVPDISRARKALGLDVWTPLEEAVQKTLSFLELRKNPLP